MMKNIDPTAANFNEEAETFKQLALEFMAAIKRYRMHTEKDLTTDDLDKEQQSMDRIQNLTARQFFVVPLIGMMWEKCIQLVDTATDEFRHVFIDFSDRIEPFMPYVRHVVHVNLYEGMDPTMQTTLMQRQAEEDALEEEVV